MKITRSILLFCIWCFACVYSVAQTPVPKQMLDMAWGAYHQSIEAQAYQPAVQALEQLSKFGDSEAMFYLATHYSLGQGVEKDAERSFKLYEKAAQAGNMEADFMVGVSYWHGSGTPQNDLQAMKIFSALAEKEHSGAQYHYAIFNAKGIGMDKNMDQAKYWLGKAAQNGNPAAIKHIRKKMLKLQQRQE